MNSSKFQRSLISTQMKMTWQAKHISVYKISICSNNFASVSLKVISHHLKIKVPKPRFCILPEAFWETKRGF